MEAYYQIARKLANSSLHPTYKMAAVVIMGGAVLSRATNLGRKTINGMPNRGRHAEERALSPHRDFKGATLCIARSDKGISKPCENCMNKIKIAGIRKIVYVDALGTIITSTVI